MCKLLCPQNTVRKCESPYSEEALQSVGIVPKVTQLSQWWREGVKGHLTTEPHSEPLFGIIWLGVRFVFLRFYHKVTKLWGVGFFWSYHGVISSRLQSHMMMQMGQLSRLAGQLLRGPPGRQSQLHHLLAVSHGQGSKILSLKVE